MCYHWRLGRFLRFSLSVVHFGMPVFFAIAIVVFSRLYSYVRNLLVRAYDQPHVLAARARALGSSAILFRHVLPLAAPPLLALLAARRSLANACFFRHRHSRIPPAL